MNTSSNRFEDRRLFDTKPVVLVSTCQPPQVKVTSYVISTDEKNLHGVEAVCLTSVCPVPFLEAVDDVESSTPGPAIYLIVLR